MSEDISEILKNWPFDSEKAVRKIVGDDGSAKLQVRLPLGLEQYELSGRPDGLRPEGFDTYLDLYRSRLEERLGPEAPKEAFQLAEEECANLRQESMLFYFRYLLCFQIGEFQQVQRDTERNMDVFRFVHEFAEREEDRNSMEQYWPYIIRMNAMARALDLSQQGKVADALDAIEKAAQRIHDLPEVETETFSLEKMRSLGVLTQMTQDLRQKAPQAPPDEAEIVRRRLQKAIADENYERAAQLRDLLQSMED